MFAGDVFVDRILTNDEIAVALSKILAIPLASVLVVDLITNIEGRVGQNILVLCEKAFMKGDFSLRLASYIRDSDLEKTVERIGNQTLTEQFCDQLGCVCLISDDSANPYSWLLVQGAGRVEIVSIDTDRSDEKQGKIFIERLLARHDNISNVA